LKSFIFSSPLFIYGKKKKENNTTQLHAMFIGRCNRDALKSHKQSAVAIAMSRVLYLF